MDSLVNDALQLFRFHWNGNLLEQIVQVRSFEETIAVHRIPVHWKVASGSPFANCVVVDAKVLGSFCSVHVFRQFGHSFWDDWQTKLGQLDAEGAYLDGRTEQAKRFSFVVEANCLKPDVKADWTAFHVSVAVATTSPPRRYPRSRK